MTEREIFMEAIRRDPPARQAFLDQACGDDAHLRHRVGLLIQADVRAGNFLEPAVPAFAGTVDLPNEPQIAEIPGTVVGPYKLMEQIGEGAVGLVFAAEQQEPVRRNVAVKIIKPGMDSAQIIARFKAERQALALMDHPNIARVFDAGTTAAGRPYFVMELVRGVSVVDYCDRGRLTVRERLKLFISICQAVQHAHNKGIIHRDLKPSNILVTPHDGKHVVKVIDFGIAKVLDQQLTDRTIYTVFLQMIGTPPYMSPEQSEINAVDVDSRSDIYSLGVLLYELLTGVTPFDAQRLASATYDEVSRIIKEEQPPKPSARLTRLGESLSEVSSRRKTDPAKLFSVVEGDLDVIVMKALEKEREQRYGTASELAADVRRFLVDEPIVARPPNPGYKLGKLVKRNRAKVLAGSLVVLTFIVGAIGTTIGWLQALAHWEQAELARRAEADEHKKRLQERDESAKTRERLASQEAVAQERRQEAFRQALIRRIEQTRRSPRSDGWSARALELVKTAATLRCDDELRDQAVACMIGLDAVSLDEKQIETSRRFDASSLAFDATGTRLAVGGADRWAGNGRNAPREKAVASVWDLPTDNRSPFAEFGAGPVAWSDGNAIQVVADPTDRLHLFLRDQGPQPVREFRIPGPSEAVSSTDASAPVLALAPDGKTAAAFAAMPPAGGALVVWNTVTGEMIREDLKIASRITSLTINATAALVAAGDARGGITLWPLPTGEPIALAPARRGEIRCLAIQKGCERFERNAEPWSGWLLAAGDNGGNLMLWDLGTRMPNAFYYGSTYGVSATAFSADGTTLAAGGRGPVKVWDVATGHLLLNLYMGEWCTGIGFSPDGRKLAASNITVHGGEGGVFCRELELGRGLQTLRGLSGQISRVCFSPRAEYVAALNHDWKVAVWKTHSGVLQHILTVPRGIAIDNADMAFSPDGQRFAFSAGVEARLWNMADGSASRAWPLPPGLHDALTFDRTGRRLMLCRLETKSGRTPPYRDTDFAADPRVCRVRDLLAAQPTDQRLDELPVVDDLATEVSEIRASPDASCFIICRATDRTQRKHVTEIYSGWTAKLLHRIPSGPFSRLDPTGKLLLVQRGEKGDVGELLEMPSGRRWGDWSNPHLRCISPQAAFGAGYAPESGGRGFSLWRRESDRPLVSFAIDLDVTAIVTPFSDTGELLGWGNSDGTVSICNVAELQRRLADRGLGWR